MHDEDDRDTIINYRHEPVHVLIAVLFGCFLLFAFFCSL